MRDLISPVIMPNYRTDAPHDAFARHLSLLRPHGGYFYTPQNSSGERGSGGEFDLMGHHQSNLHTLGVDIHLFFFFGAGAIFNCRGGNMEVVGATKWLISVSAR